MCFAVERRALFRHLNFQKWREHVVFLTFWLRNVLRATMACTFSTSQLPRVVRVMVCFVHVDFEMCFAPQRRALFRLANVLCATTACTFSTSQFPKVVRACGVCTFWLGNVLRATPACNLSSLIWPDGSAPAAALASLLFDPPEPQISGKHSVSRLSYLFAHLHLLSSDSFSSVIFSLLLFSLLLFSALWLFPSLLFICPYCRKFDL